MDMDGWDMVHRSLARSLTSGIMAYFLFYPDGLLIFRARALCCMAVGGI